MSARKWQCALVWCGVAGWTLTAATACKSSPSSAPAGATASPSAASPSGHEAKEAREAREAPGSSAASSPAPSGASPTLVDARRGFVTKLFAPVAKDGPPAVPPPAVFSLVHYPSPAGSLAAYVSPRPKDGEPSPRPAIVWLTGGMSNGIGESWGPPPSRENDQTARAFREAGVILMMPSLRGGNDNPGRRELFFGEVDDVLAAAAYLAKLDYVDPSRIYLGGHSTGATLALLVAETSDRFRGVFAFGPVGDVRGYGDILGPGADGQEMRLRSPGYFVSSLRTPTFVIEGADSDNAVYLSLFTLGAGAAPVKAYKVEEKGHFDTLAAITPLLATKILADTGAKSTLSITDEELAAAK